MTKVILPRPSFFAYNLGCRVNQAEISAISSQLSDNGFKPFSPDLPLFHSPALVIINTCAVTIKAERESRKAVHHFKRIYPKAKIIAMGCAAKFIKDADLVIENKDKENSTKIILQRFLNLNTPRRSRGRCLATIRGDTLLSDSGRALVKIQEGCDQFCSYCIVPYLRGKPKSISSKEIICQINNLVDQGIKEIILCGINLSLYGRDSSSSPQNDRQGRCQNDKQRMSQNDTSSRPEPFDLTQGKLSEGSHSGLIFLLRQILKETKAERISLSSIEPEYLYHDSEFIELFTNEPRLSKSFHLALQSGSSDTLKNMGRKTDLEKLLKVLRFIKEKCPEFTFRADIIVGFPTESEKNFQETLSFIKKTLITFAHVFPYSIRPGTLAEKKIATKQWHDLPMVIKKERTKKIMELIQKIQKEEAKKLIGKTLPCLIIRKISGGYEAMAGNSWIVRISHQPALLASRQTGRRGRSSAINSQTPIGRILPVKITSFDQKSLIGTISLQGNFDFRSIFG